MTLFGDYAELVFEEFGQDLPDDKNSYQVKNFVTFETELSTGRPSVEGILRLLSKTDSDRRPERLSLFLDTFSVLGNEQRVLADNIRNIAIRVRDIDVGSIIKMGFKGIEIKHQIELNKERIIRAELSL